MKHEKIPEGTPVYTVAYGSPFLNWYGHHAHEDGPTIRELLAEVSDLPAHFMEYGEVRISGHVIAREHWGRVRPRPGTAEKPVCVTLHLMPRGGSGSNSNNSSSKGIIGLVAALALTIATAGIAGGALAPLGGIYSALGQGSWQAGAVALSVGLEGDLRLSALG